METNTKIIDLFPTPVMMHKITEDITKDIEFLNTFKDSNERYENYDYILKNKELENLRNIILDAASQFSAELLAIEGRLALQQSWVNCKTCSTQWHRHKNSVVSGVFYFGEEYSQCLMFEKPDTSSGFMLDPLMNEEKQSQSKYAMQSVAFKPVKNSIVLFPSYLPHGVFPLTEDYKKIEHKSLAFNLITENSLGNRDFLNHFVYNVKELD